MIDRWSTLRFGACAGWSVVFDQDGQRAAGVVGDVELAADKLVPESSGDG